TYSAPQDELQVAAGIAIDRLGRLIEVPRAACMSVRRWLDHYRTMLASPDEHEGEQKFLHALTADRSEVVADVYVRFAVCARGRTPAFAVGPFDSIDASVPHRLRDAYEILLELRGGDDAPLPESPWPARPSGGSFAEWHASLRNAIIDAWRHGSESWQDGQLRPDDSTIGVSDPAAVFLARVRVPVVFAGESDVPERRMDGSAPAPVLVDNDARAIVPSTAALMRALEAL
ncbi:MAG: hypothetical protein IT378_15805, partial [Sandaracinaceae bacterium]|nr:hypothetical protein [Sandaracinaceae bacterium]